MVRQPRPEQLEAMRSELANAEMEGVRMIARMDAPAADKAIREDKWQVTIRTLERNLLLANSNCIHAHVVAARWKRLAVLSVPAIAVLTFALAALAWWKS